MASNILSTPSQGLLSSPSNTLGPKDFVAKGIMADSGGETICDY
jgi:hypothetical protein